MESTRRLIWLAVGAGALLRLVYLLWSRELVFFEWPITDALYHHRWAAAIAEGTWWDGRPFFRAPLYPYTLGLLYAVLGVHIAVGKIFGHLTGLATGVLLILLGRHLFGSRAAKVTALLWLGSGLLLFFEGELLLDSFFTFLCVAALYLLLTAEDRPGKMTISGLILGLAIITRPTALVFLPLFAWFVWRHATPRRVILIVWLVAISAPVALVAGLNSAALKRPVGVASQGGINFYIGNNASADGYTAVLPPPWGYAWNYRRLAQHAEQASGTPLDDFQVSDYYYGRGLEFIVGEPARFVALVLKKAVLSVNRVTISNNLNLPWVMRELPMLQALPVRVFWLVPLALAGMAWVSPRPGLRRYLAGFLLLYTAGLTLFFVTERFRLPLVPIWILLAAHGVAGWQGAETPRRIRAGALVIAGLLLTVPNWYGLKPNNEALAYFNLGNAALRTGENATAAAYYDSALVRTDDLHQLRLNRGLAFLRLGQLDRAVSNFAAEATRYTFDARPFNNLAAVYLLVGDTTRALTAIDSGLARDSGIGLLYMQLLSIAEAHGDTARLRADLAAAERNAGAWPVWIWWHGELSRLRNEPDSARAAYRAFSAADTKWPALDGEDQVYAGPSGAEVDYRIALTFLAPATVDSAEFYFAQAARTDSNMAEAWANWGTALLQRGRADSAVTRYRHAVTTEPRSPILWTNLAWAHTQAGRIDSALAATVQALVLDSTFGPARALELQLRAQP